MDVNREPLRRPANQPNPSRKIRLTLVAVLLLLVLALPDLAAVQDTREMGKVLEELHYQVDVWVWRDAVDTKVRFLEVGPGRYQAEIDGRTQGLLSLITGNWKGRMSSEMEYSQGKLQPLVYREISYRKGKKRVMEYRFNYAQKKVELWKQEGDEPPVKKWESALTGPIYDPLTFFYNRRVTGATFDEKGGENIKFHGIPYPKEDEITLRVGDKTPEGRKIMLELGNRIFKDERSQVFAYLDAEGVPTKAWTQVLKFGTVDIKLLPGGKRLKREEIKAAPKQAEN